MASNLLKIEIQNSAESDRYWRDENYNWRQQILPKYLDNQLKKVEKHEERSINMAERFTLKNYL